MSPAQKKKRSMSPEHKAALAEGRSQGRAVRRYLDALEAHKPKRGRKRTPDSINKRVASIEADLGTADSLRKVDLIQEKMNLEAELNSIQAKADLSELEAGFVEAAAGYSERKSISYAAWRAAGVPANVLRDAGIPRSR